MTTVISPHMNGKPVGGVKVGTSNGCLVAHWAVHANLGGPIDVHSITQYVTSITATLSITPESRKKYIFKTYLVATDYSVLTWYAVVMGTGYASLFIAPQIKITSIGYTYI